MKERFFPCGGRKTMEKFRKIIGNFRGTLGNFRKTLGNSVEPWEILTPLWNVFSKSAVFPLQRQAMGAKPRQDAKNPAGFSAEPWKSVGRLEVFGPLP